MDELIELLRTLLAGTTTLEKRLELLETYAIRFDAWYEGARADLEGGVLPRGDELAALHNEVLARAIVWKEEARGKLKAHHAKGKGILIYTDLLPKRIGLMPEKKG